MNAEILTITLPEEKPPIVDATQIFEVGGTIFQVRLNLINNMLPASAVQQEQDPPAPKPPGSLLSTEEAAAFLGISPVSLRRLCRRKAMTFIQVLPSEYRFHPDDLDEYVNSRRNRRKSVFKGPK